MPGGSELLVDDAADRTRRVGLAGVVLLVAVTAAGAALRSTLPPEPLDVQLVSWSATALRDERFVRVQLRLQASGAQSLGRATFRVAGSTDTARHLRAFDGDGRMTVQVDVVPVCAAVEAGVGTGQLDLELRDDAGDTQSLVMDMPFTLRLERLLRSRCSGADGGAARRT